MKIGVLGTGTVGKTLAGKLSALGHDVMIGTRDPDATMRRDDSDVAGGPPFRAWQAEHPQARLGAMAQAAAHGEIVVNALSGQATLEGLRTAGAENLHGKVLVDVSNPLDFSRGMPPTLFVSNTDSLGEQVQREFPDARVVNTLNTVTAALMVDPGRIGEHTIFVCGDDPAAKDEVTRLLKDGFGWRDVIDLGDVTMARGPEMVLPLWIRLWGALGTPMLGFKIVR